MKPMGRGLAPLLMLSAMLGLLLCARDTAAQTPAAPWWDDAWPYRLRVRVPPPALRAGINTARLVLEEQSALCSADGRDVRVLFRLSSNRKRRPRERDAVSDRAICTGAVMATVLLSKMGGIAVSRYTLPVVRRRWFW